MKQKFFDLAEEIKKDLEKMYSKEELNDDYIYVNLLSLIEEFKTGQYSSPKTDIGIAAIKLFDTDSPRDKQMTSNISKLARLYKNIQFFESR